MRKETYSAPNFCFIKETQCLCVALLQASQLGVVEVAPEIVVIFFDAQIINDFCFV